MHTLPLNFHTNILTIVEVIGYVGRALAYNATGELLPYLLQSVFLLLAPILFAASLYMTLGRTIRAVDGTRWSIIPPQWLTRVFVLADVFSFLIQGSGAGLLVRGDRSNSSNTQTSENIIVGGLVFQIVMFAVFCFAALAFDLRFRRNEHAGLRPRLPWRGMMVMLYATSACIMVRNVFRVVQYAMGQDGYLLEREWTVYIFDSLLMLSTMLLFWLRYPGQQVGAKPAGSSAEMELM